MSRLAVSIAAVASGAALSSTWRLRVPRASKLGWRRSSSTRSLRTPAPSRSTFAAPVNLVADHKDLIASIVVQLGAAPPAVIVIDTLNRSLVGSESKDEDMALYVKAADAIRDAFSCAVLIVHHCGLDGNRPRGHTSLTGAADAQLSVKRDSAGQIVIEVEWMKDGLEGALVVSRLESVDVGTDEDGDTI